MQGFDRRPPIPPLFIAHIPGFDNFGRLSYRLSRRGFDRLSRRGFDRLGFDRLRQRAAYIPPDGLPDLLIDLNLIPASRHSFALRAGF